jgi:hypothetical protein
MGITQEGPDTMRPPPAERLAMVTCVRDEEALLGAHLLYHRAVGVERAYVFLDRCTDGSERVASAFPWVTPIRVDPAEAAGFPYVFYLHAACMNRARELARAEGFDWLLSLDPDEFACADNAAPGDGSPAVARAHLGPLLARAAPGTVEVRLPPREVVPARLPENSPFWKQHYFQTAPALEWNVYDPVSGQAKPWAGFLGHRRGKSIVRTSADVQGYDSHRWAPEQGADYPHWPQYVELPGEDLGFHWHFIVCGARQWQDKFRKLAFEPESWFCGTPVELPKQVWKRAAGRFSDREAIDYFDRWIARPEEELARLARLGVVAEDDGVEAVLREAGCLDGDLLRLPGGAPGVPPETFHPMRARSPEPSGLRLSYPAARTAPELLRGFHPLERSGPDYFRWAEPRAAVKLSLPAGDYRLSLEMKHLCSLWRGEVRLALNDTPVPPRRRRLHEGTLTQLLLSEDFPEAAELWLRLDSPRIDTSAWPVPDPRSLGMPVFGIAFEPVPG